MRIAGVIPAVVFGVLTGCAGSAVHSGREPTPAAGERGGRTAAPTSTTHRLTGVWRVRRFCDIDSLGHQSFPLGPDPLGDIIYTPTGELSIQLMRNPSPSPAAVDTASGARVGLLDGYFGYFGTYTVTSDSTVTHHVLGGTIPNYAGTEQRRRFRIWGADGDSLSIGGERNRACRLLVRVG